MSFANTEHWISSLPIWVSFICFCCVIAEARPSSTMLNNSVDGGHPCLAPDQRGKPLSFSPLKMISALGFSYIAFIMLKYDPWRPTLLRVFIMNEYCTFSNASSASIGTIL